MNSTKICIMVGLLSLLPACKRTKMQPAEPVEYTSDNVKHNPLPQPSMITVFIHGTRIFPKFKLQEAFYSAPGLVKLTDLDASYKNVHRMARLLSEADPKRFSLDTFYSFGWSGDLSFDARREAARDLYQALQELLGHYEKTTGIRPGIRLITHSHGGNVALNLAAVKDPMHPLIINELIMLACPVQEETKHLINDRMFIKRFALVSKSDLLQRLDPQGLHGDKESPFFSERYFPNYPRLVQARIKIHGRSITHLEFILSSFTRRLPAILDLMDGWYEAMMDSAEQSQGWEIPVIDLHRKIIKISPTKVKRTLRYHCFGSRR